jgi:hypothetical protein
MTTEWDGLPENPDRHGYHWLELRSGGQRPVVWQWEPDMGGWMPMAFCVMQPAEIAPAMRYLGPCRPPEAAAHG